MKRERVGHWTSGTAIGETCRVRDFTDRTCGANASHKIGEEIPDDHPAPIRHNLTAYVCCFHFKKLLGPRACELSVLGVGVDNG